MSEINLYKLPLGLPARLVSEPDGFEAFCKLLKINSRSDKQFILKIVYDKKLLKSLGFPEGKRQKTSDRLQQNLIYSFSIPKLRVALWKYLYKRTDGFAKHPTRRPVCLEYYAFQEYKEQFFDVEVNEKDLKKCRPFFEFNLTQEDWQKPALALLPLVYDELSNWECLTPVRRSQTVLAAFSIATLLNDFRLLNWAAEEIPDVLAELDFLVANEGAADTGSILTKATSEEVSAALDRACINLSEIALELSRGPYSKDSFDQIANYAKEIARLSAPVLEIGSTVAAEKLIAEYSDFLKSQSGRAPWLAAMATDIESKWQKYHIDESVEIADEDELLADIEKCKLNVDEQMKKWIVADTNLNETNALLQELQNQPPPSDVDLVAQQEYGESERLHFSNVAAARDQELKQKQKVIDVAFPYDKQFPKSEISGDEKAGIDEEDSNSDDTGEVGEESHLPSDDVGLVDSESSREDIADEEDKFQKVTPEPTMVEEATDGEVDVESSYLPSPSEIAMWDSIGEGKLGLAYQIARLRQKVATEDYLYPSPNLLATVAFGSLLHGPDDLLTQEFVHHFRPVLENQPHFNFDDSKSRDAINLLLFSASLRPVFFASPSGAISVLKSVELSGDLTTVYQFAMKVVDYAEKLQGVHFDLQQLTSMLDSTLWEKRLEDITNQVSEWVASAPGERYQFEPSNKLWQYWLSKNGILRELANAIAKGTASSVEKVQKIVEQFADKKSFDSFAEATLRKEAKVKTVKSMPNHALTQLSRHSAKPIDLAQEWLRIIESKPGRENYVKKIVSELRAEITDCGPRALTEIAALLERESAVSVVAALKRAQNSIEDLMTIFAQDFSYVPINGAQIVNRVLLRDILYVASLDICTDGGIDRNIEPEDALGLLIDKNSHSQDLADAFAIRFQRRNIAGAQVTWDQMNFENCPDKDQFRAQLDEAIANLENELGHDLDELSEKLEQAFTIGEFSESELENLNADIVDARNLCRVKATVVSASEKISGFKDRIEEKFHLGIIGVQDQLNKFFPLDDPREKEFIQEALASSDLITLYEQLDRLKNGEPILPVGLEPHQTLDDFLSKVPKIDEFLDRNDACSSDDVIDLLSQNEAVLGLNFSSLTFSQSQRAGRMLELWFNMARNENADENNIGELLDHLGFSVKKCELRSGNSLRIFTEPLRNRELCPVPAFGSDADGHYNMVLNWRSPPQEKIVQLVGENLSQCTIVLNFGRLGESREWLADWSIQNRSLFIVIDESLILYLSSLQSGVLRALFDCTLPFTCIEPFFTASGLVPPESFYGREGERSRVMDRRGSCFVFGGRQLGKTALLRSAEASVNHSENNNVAIYIDLKVRDVGIAYGAEHIWKVLWACFQERDVIDDGEHPPRSRDKLVENFTNRVKTWLSNSEDCRILLLLDEADAFLTSDLKSDFRESTRIKGLMDETDRKFKVVFSGLHNVLRTTESANHPLAHFGEPVCVGPLLSNGELEQARALIREPLAAAGFKFEKDSLTTNILVWTNYYPSLIQLCGAELVKYLRESTVRDYPHSITKEDINVLFSKDGLRDFIRQRFSLTLQLDPRYEVIAYAIALDLQGDKEGLANGLSPSNIFESSKEWWSIGFEITQKEFYSLLNELCGLGVLRKHLIDGKRPTYTFRNPNVLLLLGEPMDIEQVLYKDRAVPEVFEASAYHAQYPEERRHDSPRRGPLNFEQESQLRRTGGVTVISGTNAANFECISEFLDQRLDNRTFRILNFCTDEVGLERQLTGQRPVGESVHVYLVPFEAPWTIRWVSKAVAVVNRVKRGKFMQIVFPANAQQLWRFAGELPDAYFEDLNGLFEWMDLLPWNRAFLRRWCDDQNFQVATPQVNELLEISGGWPYILEQYAKLSEHNWQSNELAINEYIKKNRLELLAKFGLESNQSQDEITILQEYGAFTPETVQLAVDMINESAKPGLNTGTLIKRLWWAKHLGLIQEFQGNWNMNSLVQKVLINHDS